MHAVGVNSPRNQGVCGARWIWPHAGNIDHSHSHAEFQDSSLSMLMKISCADAFSYILNRHPVRKDNDAHPYKCAQVKNNNF